MGASCIQSNVAEGMAVLDVIRANALRDHIPLRGSLELTRRCNMRCVHCYATPHTASEASHPEMTTQQVLHVLDEIVESGCLELTLTGGEPLARADFAEIYRHGRSQGLLITVFSNGTLIDDAIVELFREYPPLGVEITLYGASEETYEKMTGVSGSYRACLKGIQRLKDNNVPLTLKTVTTQINHHEFGQIELMARELGARFRYDAGIFPRLNGDNSPLALRLSPEDAVVLDFCSEDRHEEWRKIKERSRGKCRSDILYACAAGKTSFHLDASGFLQPCVIGLTVRVSVLEIGFAESWRQMGQVVREKQVDPQSVCVHCDDWFACQSCPAHAFLESGSEQGKSMFLCKLAKLRAERLMG